jgi:hypothetical protein
VQEGGIDVHVTSVDEVVAISDAAIVIFAIKEGLVNACAMVVPVVVTVMVMAMMVVAMMVVAMVVVAVVVVGVVVIVSMVVVVVSMVMAVVMIVVVVATKVVVSITAVENSHLDQVEEDSHNGNNEHDSTLDLGGLEEALGGLNEEPHGHNPNYGNRDHRADDLGSVPAEGVVVSGASLTKSESSHRDGEANHVRGQMGGVSEDSD